MAAGWEDQTPVYGLTAGRVEGDALHDGDFADQRTAALLYAGNFLFAPSGPS